MQQALCSVYILGEWTAPLAHLFAKGAAARTPRAQLHGRRTIVECGCKMRGSAPQEQRQRRGSSCMHCRQLCASIYLGFIFGNALVCLGLTAAACSVILGRFKPSATPGQAQAYDLAFAHFDSCHGEEREKARV
jgi:hypothetical protein